MKQTHAAIPRTTSISSDALAGFVVFLIALPLCVGIAVASDAPPAAGLIAAMVGGIIGSFITGSKLTINGPAAGLIVVVIEAIHSLGHGDNLLGFKLALGCFVIAGALQVVFGALKLGVYAFAIPKSVVHGMLVAIGVTIVAKQIPVLIGVKPAASSILMLIASLPTYLLQANPEIALIGVSSLFFLTAYRDHFKKLSQIVPAPLLIAIAGYAMAKHFDLEHIHSVVFTGFSAQIGPQFLLNIPNNFASLFTVPDFSQVLSLEGLNTIFMICFVSSVESLLSAHAVDKIDPFKRKSDFNRELLGKGICNMVSAGLGGLPIIAEIVRSSANIAAGAKSIRANFFHGAYMLVFVALFPWLLHGIPLAALAAILISVGMRLADPKQFLHAAEIGREHITSFAATVAVTLATDILIGVGTGIAIELAYALLNGVKITQLFKPLLSEKPVEQYEGRTDLVASSPLLFTHALSLSRTLNKITGNNVQRVDLSRASFVDHTILDQIEAWRLERLNIGHDVAVVFSDSHKSNTEHPLAARSLPRVKPTAIRMRS